VSPQLHRATRRPVTRRRALCEPAVAENLAMPGHRQMDILPSTPISFCTMMGLLRILVTEIP